MEKIITVVGLGAGDIDQMPLGVYRKFLSADSKIYTRTMDHPVIKSLEKEGVQFQSFDEVYEKHQTFEPVYQEIANQLLKAAEHSPVLYATPGHPMLAERTVQILLEEAEGNPAVEVKVGQGQSYLDALFSSLKIDPIEGFQFLDGTSFRRFEVQYDQHVVFSQVYDDMIASDVKLTLMDDLPDDYPITVVHGAGSNEEWIKTVPLYELDRSVPFSNLLSVYVPPAPKEIQNHQFNRLREVIAILRGPNGCPWDRKQTHESLRPYLIEEAYEVIEAINEQDDEKVADELGDVLLQIMLHGQIGEDEGYFSVDDVIKNITDKMIRRHPHVFGDFHLNTSEEVVKTWDEIKKEEKGGEVAKSIVDDIERSLPALLTAYELQKKTAKAGFDWENFETIFDKIKEEIEEFEQSIAKQTSTEMEKEFGDILFSLVNLARHRNINPELALSRSNQIFKKRFQYIEKRTKEMGKTLETVTLEGMDQFWNEAKEYEKER
ncbi:tetrapyrrole methylase family protein / MazG family protein [Salinibacillus kushneri]|uniref:Tetrapyrrole methylase family protein / MazG family protein n=1 Tax=Salinibacillus kushneri TaxID=237682 RepID=A0A1I0J9S4_9BACI|nr:nucleoside triphosphate pyrophosphohydrolase [Salinibacillus kushneri]SEU06468.1 tetrapyrrole methylase family protein / MazG family protein [Salinibacillus kushneri]